MIWVGITGSMGSGKSTVCKLIADLGYPVISADKVSHKLTEPGRVGLEAIVEQFGSSVLKSNGELDRHKLSKIVFSDKHLLKSLENILHPLIQQYVKQWRQVQQDNGCKMSFYDIPLLFENNLQDQFDQVVSVIAPNEMVLDRVEKRDGAKPEDINARLSHQTPVEIKRQRSDFVIDNDGSMQDLSKKVEQLILQLSHL